MSKRFALALTLLFVGLTVIYFRDSIFSPLDTWIMRYQGSDLYIYYLGAYERLGMLKDGFLPVGDYWIPRGGGYAATTQELLIAPTHLLLMATYAITNNFTMALRILYPLTYLATLFTAYWYGTTILKDKASSSIVKYASIVLAVSYGFCVFGSNTIEQPPFIGSMPFILLTLIFLEKTIKESKPLYIILTTVFLLTVCLNHLYMAYFLTAFIGFRILFVWRKEVLRSAIIGGILLVLLAAPFFIPQIAHIPSEGIQSNLQAQTGALAVLPGLFFFKSDPMSFASEASIAYMGLVTLALALLPLVIHKVFMWRRTYVFYLLAAIIFALFAVGQYGPINLALMVQKYLPLSFFLRVPGRAMVIGSLALSACATFGFVALISRIKPKYIALTTMVIVLALFADLSIGYEPPTMATPISQNEAYEFLRERPGDFRVIEIPSIYPQMALADIYTDHDVLSTFSWAFGYFEPLHSFAAQYNNYLNLTATEQETSFYGVKYVIVNTDADYYTNLRTAIQYQAGATLKKIEPVADYISSSKDSKLVYNSNGYAIYENLLYQGTVFPCESYKWKDPNTLIIDTNSNSPQQLFISQSYAEGWVAKVNGVRTPINEVNSIQSIDVPAGLNHVVVHYQNYQKWFVIAALSWSAALAFGLWICLRRRVHV